MDGRLSSSRTWALSGNSPSAGPAGPAAPAAPAAPVAAATLARAAAHGTPHAVEPPLAGLSHLPPEVVERVGDYLGGPDLCHLSQCSRAMASALDAHLLRERLAGRARRVCSVAAMDALLTAIAAVPRQTSRAAPLAELAERISVLPALQRLAVFRKVLAACIGLPAPHRYQPLRRLIAYPHCLPSQERASAFRALARASAQMPSAEGAQLLSRLLNWLSCLPASDVRIAFQDALGAVRSLAPERQAAALARFAKCVGWLPLPGERLSVFASLFDVLQTLAPTLRHAPLAELAQMLGVLPREKRGAWHRGICEACASARESVDAASAAGVVSALAHGIPCVPLNERVEPFDRTIGLLERVGERQRGLPLLELARRLGDLPLPARHEAWQNVVAMSRELPKPDRVPVLLTARTATGSLPLAEQAAALDLIRRELRRAW